MRLNRFDMFALVAAIVTTVLFLGAALNAASLYASVRPWSAYERIVGCAGWSMATFGPIAVSVLFWRWSKRLRMAWILHLLMLPVSYALIMTGGRLMLFVIGVPDFDDTIGGPVLQATVLSGSAVVGYYAAVLIQVLRKAASGGRPAS